MKKLLCALLVLLLAFAVCGCREKKSGAFELDGSLSGQELMDAINEHINNDQ